MKKIHNFSIIILLLLIHFALPLHGMGKTATRSANPPAQAANAMEELVAQVHAISMARDTSLFNLINQNQEQMDNRLKELEHRLQALTISASRKDLPQAGEQPRAPNTTPTSATTTTNATANTSSASSTPESNNAKLKKQDVPMDPEQEIREIISCREKRIKNIRKEDEEDNLAAWEKVGAKFHYNVTHIAANCHLRRLVNIREQEMLCLLDHVNLLEHMPEWRSSFDKKYIDSLNKKIDFINRKLTKAQQKINSQDTFLLQDEAFFIKFCSEEIDKVMRETNKEITLALNCINDVRDVVKAIRNTGTN